MKYQTTRKLWMLLLTAALLALLFLPAALAEETLPSVHVTLGDGACWLKRRSLSTIIRSAGAAIRRSSTTPARAGSSR